MIVKVFPEGIHIPLIESNHLYQKHLKLLCLNVSKINIERNVEACTSTKPLYIKDGNYCMHA